MLALGARAQSMPASAPVSAAAPVPAGPLTTPYIRFVHSVYYAAAPTTPPMPILEGILKTRRAPPQHLERVLPAAPDVAAVSAVFVREGYPLPDVPSILAYGHGVSQEQAQGLQTGDGGVILSFAHPSARAADSLRAATEIVDLLARLTGGVIWDNHMRKMYSPDEWRARKLNYWRVPWPEARKHYSWFTVEDGGTKARATEGMVKFGLPDLIIREAPASLAKWNHWVMELVAQALVEGIMPTSKGRFELDRRTRPDGTRWREAGALKPNTPYTAILTLTEAAPHPRSPTQRRLRISFDQFPGADHNARAKAAFVQLFGPEVTEAK